MESNNPNYVYKNVIQLNDDDSSRKFLAKVFTWMFVALAVSAASAYAVVNTSLLLAFVDTTTNQLNGLAMLVRFAPLAFILIISFGFNRLSYSVLSILFIAYSIVTGISLAFWLIAFTPSSAIGVFITTSVVFGIMAIAGYTTKTDLTKFGSILIMFLIGIVVASVVNWFLHSSGLDMIISYIGVAVFVGLTAYDVQKLKNIGAGITYGGDATASKMALMGGLTLYLDFVNLFLMLLRIFGRRR